MGFFSKFWGVECLLPQTFGCFPRQFGAKTSVHFESCVCEAVALRVGRTNGIASANESLLCQVSNIHSASEFDQSLASPHSFRQLFPSIPWRFPPPPTGRKTFSRCSRPSLPTQLQLPEGPAGRRNRQTGSNPHRRARDEQQGGPSTRLVNRKGGL